MTNIFNFYQYNESKHAVLFQNCNINQLFLKIEYLWFFDKILKPLMFIDVTCCMHDMH